MVFTISLWFYMIFRNAVKQPKTCPKVSLNLAYYQVNKIKKEDNLSIVFFSTPSGARTLDPNIKSVVLYQLS